jgi:gluconolactonase
MSDAPMRYPDPNIKILDPRFSTLVLGNAAIEVIAGGCRFTEGPVWFGDGRFLLWSDIPNNRIMKWEEETGAVSLFRKPSHYANGNTRDRQGRLVTCEMDAQRLTRTEYDGTVTVLAERFDDKQLTGPNDVVVKSDGSIWFSDPVYGISTDYEGGRQTSEQPPALYRFDPGSGDIRIVADDFDGPNGLAFSPDEKRLYVAETGDQTRAEPRQYIRVFDVAADGASLSGGEIFHKIEPGYCDGMRVDEDGNVWSSAADGVHCISPDGELLGKIRVPHLVSNLVFGGVRKNRLFIGGSHTLYAIFLNRRGAQWP